MHEASIIQSTLVMAEKYARGAGAAGIKEIRLRIGQMSGAVPEALQHAFTIMREGTIAQEAQLAIECVPALYWCEPCQTEFSSQEWFGECPTCGTLSTDRRSGMDIELIAMEVY